MVSKRKKKIISAIVLIILVLIPALLVGDSYANARKAQKDGLPFWKTFFQSIAIKLNLKYG